MRFLCKHLYYNDLQKWNIEKIGGMGRKCTELGGNERHGSVEWGKQGSEPDYWTYWGTCWRTIRKMSACASGGIISHTPSMMGRTSETGTLPCVPDSVPVATLCFS